VDEIERGLTRYSLATIPVQGYVHAAVQPKAEPFYLLCHDRVRKWPVLQAEVHGAELELRVRSPGHDQIADLALRVWTASGEAYWVRPTGELSERALVARSGLLMTDTGERQVELLRWKVPAEIVRLEARLLNPGARGETDFALAGEPAQWKR
jgi:hypothetical protein